MGDGGEGALRVHLGDDGDGGRGRARDGEARDEQRRGKLIAEAERAERMRRSPTGSVAARLPT